MYEYKTRSPKHRYEYRELEGYRPPISKEDETELLGIIENQIKFSEAINSLCDKLNN